MDARDLEARLPEVRRLAAAALSGWRQHPDFEDMVQEGVIRTWLALSRNPGAPLSTFACQNARWAATDWLRSARAWRRCVHTGQAPDPEFVGLSQLPAEEHPAAPDEIEVLIDRLDAGALMRQFLAVLSERERPLMAALFTDGLTLKAAGERCGISEPRVWQMKQQALNRLRGSLGAKRSQFEVRSPAARRRRMLKERARQKAAARAAAGSGAARGE